MQKNRQMKHFYIILLVIACSFTSCFEDKNRKLENQISKTELANNDSMNYFSPEIDRIYFEFNHSMRYVFHKVQIDIFIIGNSPRAKVISIPMNNDEKWEHSKIDTTINISKEKYIEVLTLIQQISDINNGLNKDTIGIDGSTWKIKYGNEHDLQSYFIHSPNYYTEEPGLLNFIEASKLIIETVGLNPNEILIE